MEKLCFMKITPRSHIERTVSHRLSQVLGGGGNWVIHIYCAFNIFNCQMRITCARINILSQPQCVDLKLKIS